MKSNPTSMESNPTWKHNSWTLMMNSVSGATDWNLNHRSTWLKGGHSPMEILNHSNYILNCKLMVEL